MSRTINNYGITFSLSLFGKDLWRDKQKSLKILLIGDSFSTSMNDVTLEIILYLKYFADIFVTLYFLHILLPLPLTE